VDDEQKKAEQDWLQSQVDKDAGGSERWRVMSEKRSRVKLEPAITVSDIQERLQRYFAEEPTA